MEFFLVWGVACGRNGLMCCLGLICCKPSHFSNTKVDCMHCDIVIMINPREDVYSGNLHRSCCLIYHCTDFSANGGGGGGAALITPLLNTYSMRR